MQFKELDDVNNRHFKDATAIYVESLPQSERQPICVIEERVAGKKEKMFVGFLNHYVVFMALIWPLKGTDFVLLDYMATRPAYRNRGIGREFLKNIFETCGFDNKHVILEVEDPRYGNRRKLKARRVEFYRRSGAKKMMNVGYVLPPLSGGTPSRMIVMVLSPENLRVDSLPASTVTELFGQIYRELYGRKANDPLLNSFVNKVPSVVELV